MMSVGKTLPSVCSHGDPNLGSDLVSVIFYLTSVRDKPLDESLKLIKTSVFKPITRVRSYLSSNHASDAVSVMISNL